MVEEMLALVHAPLKAEVQLMAAGKGFPIKYQPSVVKVGQVKLSESVVPVTDQVI